MPNVNKERRDFHRLKVQQMKNIKKQKMIDILYHFLFKMYWN